MFAEMHLVISFFLNFNQHWDVSTFLAKTFQQFHQNLFSVVKLYADKLTEKHGKANRRIFVTFHCERIRSYLREISNAFANIFSS